MSSTTVALSPPLSGVAGTGAWRRKAALVLLVTALFVTGFQGFLTVQPRADLHEHISSAEQIHSFADITWPHFLFQLLLKGVHALGVGYSVAAAWLLGLCYGGMAWLIAGELERRRVVLSTAQLLVVIPALLIASHVFLLTASKPNLYYGYFVPITYHNATQQLNKLFALWIYFVYCAAVLDAERPPRRTAALMGVLCVLSALAKPSFLVAFLPASGLNALGDVVHRRWRRAAFFATGIALPSVAVLLWQYRAAYGGEGMAVIFAPFVVFDFSSTLYKLPASLFFPLTVAACARGGESAIHLRFTWLFVGLALLATLFLAEAQNVMAGNFAWTGQTAVFLVYVESVLFLLVSGRRHQWAWAAFALHVACGAVWYAVVFWAERPSWL